ALSTFGNSFGFLAGPEGTNSDIFLQGGDNILIFAAENNTYHTTVERNIIYDDGEPFVYDVRFKGTDDKLIKDPQITSSGTVTITGKMKLDNIRNEANLIIPEYLVKDVEVEVLGVGDTEAVVTSFYV